MSVDRDRLESLVMGIVGVSAEPAECRSHRCRPDTPRCSLDAQRAPACQPHDRSGTNAKMNVDENREIPAKFGIRGIPTLMVFKDGQLAATKVGAMSKAQLTAFIDQQL